MKGQTLGKVMESTIHVNTINIDASLVVHVHRLAANADLVCVAIVNERNVLKERRTNDPGFFPKFFHLIVSHDRNQTLGRFCVNRSDLHNPLGQRHFEVTELEANGWWWTVALVKALDLTQLGDFDNFHALQRAEERFRIGRRSHCVAATAVKGHVPSFLTIDLTPHSEIVARHVKFSKLALILQVIYLAHGEFSATKLNRELVHVLSKLLGCLLYTSDAADE